MIPSGNLAELSNIVICSWITYQKWSIFHSYVRLPEGIPMSQYKLPEAKSFIVTNKHYQSLYSSITIHVGKTMPCLPPMAGNDANIPPVVWWFFLELRHDTVASKPETKASSWRWSSTACAAEERSAMHTKHDQQMVI